MARAKRRSALDNTFIARPYGIPVVVCASTAARIEAESALDDAYDPDDEDVVQGAAGYTLPIPGGAIIITVLDGSLATLVHECGHAAMFILQRCGIDPTDSNGETYCYLLEDLFTQARALIHPARGPASRH